MATLVNTGSQSSAAGVNTLTTNSPSATAGNKLVLQIAWLNANSGSTATAPAISGWTLIYGPTTAKNAGASVICGYALYTKTAAGGVESPVFTDPISNNNLFAHGMITEWSGMGAHDTQDSSATSTNNSAASTTGATIPNTGTLTSANSTVFTGISIAATTGKANANIAFSGGSWTTEFSSQDTNADVGALVGHKTVSSNAALGTVFTYDTDTSMLCYQGADVVFSDSGGGGTTITPSAGSLAVTGQTASRATDFARAAAVGALALTGLAATVTNSGLQTRQPSAGSLVLSGSAPTVANSGQRNISPAAGSLALTGLTSTQDLGTSPPQPGALSLNGGNAPVLSFGTVRTGSVAALALTGIAPSVTQQLARTPSVGALSISGNAAQIQISGALTPTAAALTLSGIAPSVSQQLAIQPSAGALALTGFAPSIGLVGSIQPNSGALTLAGNQPGVTQQITIRPNAVSLSLSGLQPQISSNGSPNLTPNAGAASINGLQPTITQGFSASIQPSTGSLLIGGLQAGLSVSNITIRPGAASLTLSGLPAAFGNVFPAIGGRTVRLASRDTTVKVH